MDYKRFFPAVLELFVNRISYNVCRNNNVLLKLGYIHVCGYFAGFSGTQPFVFHVAIQKFKDQDI